MRIARGNMRLCGQIERNADSKGGATSRASGSRSSAGFVHEYGTAIEQCGERSSDAVNRSGEAVA
jgi:hypothetical protein